MRLALAVPVIALLALTACNKDGPATPEGQETDVPKDLAKFAAPKGADQGLGTPREQRVATLGLLNKRNNLTQDIKIKPGESKRVGDVVVRLATCERTPPWELPPETGAFVQVIVAERTQPGANPTWKRVFSGWLFKNSPSLNAVEHPIYDVWVKDCAMSFPGDEAPLPTESGAPKPAASPSATPSPAPSASASNPA